MVNNCFGQCLTCSLSFDLGQAPQFRPGPPGPYRCPGDPARLLSSIIIIVLLVVVVAAVVIAPTSVGRESSTRRKTVQGKRTDWDYVHELVIQGRSAYEKVSLVPSKYPHIKNIREMCNLHIQETKEIRKLNKPIVT